MRSPSFHELNAFWTLRAVDHANEENLRLRVNTCWRSSTKASTSLRNFFAPSASHRMPCARNCSSSSTGARSRTRSELDLLRFGGHRAPGDRGLAAGQSEIGEQLLTVVGRGYPGELDLAAHHTRGPVN